MPREARLGLLLGLGLVIVSMMVNLGVIAATVTASGVFGQVLVIAALAGAGWLVSRGDDEAVPSARVRARRPLNVAPAWLKPAQTLVWCATICVMYVWVVGPLRAEWAARRGDNLRGDSIEAALREYHRAVELDPASIQLWTRLADGYRQAAARCADRDGRAGFLLDARSAIEQALALEPDDAERHGKRARILTDLARLGRADPAQALEEYDLALNLDPNNAYLLADAANAALTLSRLERARDYAERGLQRYPDFAVLRAHVGYVALEQNRPGEAVRWISESLNCPWHGEDAGQAFARKMLVVAIDRMHAAQP